MQFNKEKTLVTQATPSEALLAGRTPVAVELTPEVIVPPRPNLKAERGALLRKRIARAIGFTEKDVTSAEIEEVLRESIPSEAAKTITFFAHLHPESYIATLERARNPNLQA